MYIMISARFKVHSLQDLNFIPQVGCKFYGIRGSQKADGMLANSKSNPDYNIPVTTFLRRWLLFGAICE